MSTASRISSFVQLDGAERFDREFFITHTTLRRFSIGMIVALLWWLGVVAALVWLPFEEEAPRIIALLIVVLPGLIAILYFSLRSLRISYGYATVTNRRVLYYEFNNHPAENYHFVKSLYLSDITAVRFQIEQGLLRKSFAMTLFTESAALAVGATKRTGWLKWLSRANRLEPGPDALEFIQYLSGQIALGQFQGESASKAEIT